MWKKSVNPNLQCNVQTPLQQGLVRGIPPLRVPRPSPIFRNRATRWDAWSFVWELRQRSAVQRCTIAAVVKWCDDGGVNVEWHCGDSSLNSLAARGTRPLGRCGGSVAGGPLSSPGGRPLLVCKDGARRTRCYCGGGFRWCWSLRETSPRDFPRCFHHLLEERTEGRAHGECTWGRENNRKVSTCVGCKLPLGILDRHVTWYIHIHTRIVVCMPSKIWPGNGKKRTQRSHGLLFYCFDGLASPFFFFHILLLPFPPFSLPNDFITCVPLSVLSPAFE